MSEHDLVLVVDFGAQYAQLIARRVREAQGLLRDRAAHDAGGRDAGARSPKAIVLSGGPSSVYAEGAPAIDTALFTAGVPVFGMCYGFQLMAQALGGEVARTGAREYGRTRRLGRRARAPCSPTIPAEHTVWMSHGDSVTAAPAGFTVLARRRSRPVAAFEDVERGLAGVQWHPEVLHTEHGQQVLEHFLLDIAGCRPTWTMVNIVEEQIERDPRPDRRRGQAICGLSGGVDSAVAAALVQRAIGDRLTCVYVDHGLMRKGETEQVERDFVAATGRGLKVVDAEKQFLDALAGVVDPEEKRKIIGREFIRVFEAAEAEVLGDAASDGRRRSRSSSRARSTPTSSSPAAAPAPPTSSPTTTSAACPTTSSSSWSSRCARCSRTRCAWSASSSACPPKIVWRQPFPGPGLGIRIIGEVTRERLDILREADAIAREELTRAGLDRDIWQFPVVLLADVRSVGVQGDGRTYGHPVVLRPVTSEDAMTADWARLPYDVLERISTRITNEVREVNRVTVDITSQAPGHHRVGVSRLPRHPLQRVADVGHVGLLVAPKLEQEQWEDQAEPPVRTCVEVDRQPRAFGD